MSPEARARGDEGSALAEFVMVSVLVIVVAMAVIQLALTLHVRNLLVSSASEGARLAAANDRAPEDGVARTEQLIAASLGGYPAEVSAAVTVVGGSEAVEITVSAPVPLVGLWGVGDMTVAGRALEEMDRG